MMRGLSLLLVCGVGRSGSSGRRGSSGSSQNFLIRIEGQGLTSFWFLVLSCLSVSIRSSLTVERRGKLTHYFGFDG